MIDYWQQQTTGHISVKGALELADSFSDECKNRTPIPLWVFALRALAGRIRLHEQVSDRPPS